MILACALHHIDADACNYATNAKTNNVGIIRHRKPVVVYCLQCLTQQLSIAQQVIHIIIVFQIYNIIYLRQLINLIAYLFV